MTDKRRHQEPPPAPTRTPRVCRCTEPMLDDDDIDETQLCWKCRGVVIPDPPEAAA